MKPSHRHLGLRLIFCCCVAATFSRGQPLSAAVTVQTADGRTLSGEVDVQTDSKRLWIRQESEHIVLTTSVPWSSITSASSDHEVLPIAELPRLLGQQASSEPVGFLVQQAVANSAAGCEGECLPASLAHQPLPSDQSIRSSTPPVRSLSVDAYLVNLDRDVEPDGLELVVAALDDWGVPVPVKGSLYVRLWGERIQPDGSLIRFEQLQLWSQPVMPADFVDGLARYALRFRTVHPEFDLGLRPEAQVNVRLGVFGQGNFATTVPVEIRHFNPFRDRLQLDQGSRFLPHELTQAARTLRPRRIDSRTFRDRSHSNLDHRHDDR